MSLHYIVFLSQMCQAKIYFWGLYCSGSFYEQEVLEAFYEQDFLRMKINK